MRHCRAISDLLMPARRSRRISAACAAVVAGRPSRIPFSRACASPALVRSRRISRSNSAKMANRPAIARPAGVVRSSASVKETNPTPRCSLLVAGERPRALIGSYRHALHSRHGLGPPQAPHCSSGVMPPFRGFAKTARLRPESAGPILVYDVTRVVLEPGRQSPPMRCVHAAARRPKKAVASRGSAEGFEGCVI